MNALPTHAEHQDLGAVFQALGGAEVVRHYGDPAAEYRWLTTTAAVLDFSFRTRLVVAGSDRVRFLHSQCTNDLQRLAPGTGCYTAITNNKGRLEGDANVLLLAEEVLLDSEPGQAEVMTARLNRYLVSDDVTLLDAAPHYGLLTVQGPRAAAAVAALELETGLPAEPWASARVDHPVLGEMYLVNLPRLGTAGADLYVPVASLGAVLDRLITATRAVGGGVAGWEAFDLARVEAGIPRFGVDMTGANLAPEAGLETRAISYTKGCYIGQEILNRLRTFAGVTRGLRGLWLPADLAELPPAGAPLLQAGRAVGQVTSAVRSPRHGRPVALAYVRKEAWEPGTPLEWPAPGGPVTALVTGLPFAAAPAPGEIPFAPGPTAG